MHTLTRQKLGGRTTPRQVCLLLQQLTPSEHSCLNMLLGILPLQLVNACHLQ